MTKISLDEFRDDISNIDSEIFELLNRRFEISKKIGIFKSKENIQSENKVRETELFISAISNLRINSNISEKFIKEFYEIVLNESKSLQVNKNINK